MGEREVANAQVPGILCVEVAACARFVDASYGPSIVDRWPAPGGWKSCERIDCSAERAGIRMFVESALN